MKVFELNKFNIVFDERIISIEYRQNVEISIDDALEIFKILNENNDPKEQYGLLTIACNVKNMTREARDFFGEKKVENINFDAVVYKNAIQKMIGDLYFSLSHPIRTTKFFTNKEIAIDWLKTKLN